MAFGREKLPSLNINMKVYLAVEEADTSYNSVVTRVFSTEEKAKEYMEQTNKDYGWQVVNRIDEVEVE